MILLRKIGLFGGSFDPVHHGHLILARTALEQLELERVIFLPAGISPHKLHCPPAPAEIRCEMLAAAISGEPDFSWDDCEIKREGPSFAVDTVRLIREQNPGAKIFYFIGDDNLAALHTWKEISALRELMQFVVLSRKIEEVDYGFPVISRCIDISSTDIRNRIARGLSIRYLVPDAVCQIITRYQLYRNE